MQKVKLLDDLNKSVNRACFNIKKNSPQILIGFGVVGVVASAVAACLATRKIDSVLEDTKNELDRIHETVEADEPIDKKELAMAYAQGGLKIAKLYAGPVILGTLSLTSILASNKILRERNVALAAAYAVVDKGFKEYRSRVVDRFGSDVDRELRYNIQKQMVSEPIVDENGKERKVKKAVEVVNIDDYSIYARFFDEASRHWEKDAEYNLMFLKAEQNYANDCLRANGRLFLNEVYERLDIPKTKAGQVVGWVYDSKNPKGDNYVDFGIYDTNKRNAAFVNGYERSILLDFNVDGNVWETM